VGTLSSLAMGGAITGATSYNGLAITGSGTASITVSNNCAISFLNRMNFSCSQQPSNPNTYQFPSGPGGNILITMISADNTQTLTNKTLTAPSITLPTITSPIVTEGTGFAGIGIRPSPTNSVSCGSSANIFTTVWATSGVVSTSDGNLKKNKIPLDKTKVRSLVDQLNPISYNWISGDDGQTRYGFIAQEVEAAREAAGFDDDALVETYNIADEGEPEELRYFMRYTELVPVLTAYVQTITDNLIPSIDNLYDIGSSAKRYANLYMTGSVITTSDFRKKENIRHIEENTAIEFISELEPKTYNLIGKRYEERHGLIAQDIQQVCNKMGISGIVKESETGMLGVAYMEIIPYLIAHNKSLEKRVSRSESVLKFFVFVSLFLQVLLFFCIM
jgi:hypothetical protein